ncbi:MAG: hypothetical protein EA388_16065 [Nitriliruptor sp.]|nr:MAG: hypothetical protein EA388_16065 [Nitriliruptor sp.]
MTVRVDTSAWIEDLRGTGSPHTTYVRHAILADRPLEATELILSERTAGDRSSRRAAELRALLLCGPILTVAVLQDRESVAALPLGTIEGTHRPLRHRKPDRAARRHPARRPRRRRWLGRGDPTAQTQTVEPLTVREKEILRGVARGRTNQAIAAERRMAFGTVKPDPAVLMRKLAARNPVGIATWAHETGRVRRRMIRRPEDQRGATPAQGRLVGQSSDEDSPSRAALCCPMIKAESAITAEVTTITTLGCSGKVRPANDNPRRKPPTRNSRCSTVSDNTGLLNQEIADSFPAGRSRR